MHIHGTPYLPDRHTYQIGGISVHLDMFYDEIDKLWIKVPDEIYRPEEAAFSSNNIWYIVMYVKLLNEEYYQYMLICQEYIFE
jgi:hypothetical protein